MPKPDSIEELAQAIHDLRNDVAGYVGEEGEIAQLRRAVDEQNTKAIKTLHKTWWLILAAVVGYATLGVMIYTLFRLDHFAAANHKNSSAVVISCRALNEQGAAQKELWGPFLDRPVDPNSTPQEIADAVRFKAAVERLAVQRDCDKL